MLKIGQVVIIRQRPTENGDTFSRHYIGDAAWVTGIINRGDHAVYSLYMQHSKHTWREEDLQLRPNVHNFDAPKFNIGDAVKMDGMDAVRIVSRMYRTDGAYEYMFDDQEPNAPSRGSGTKERYLTLHQRQADIYTLF